MDQQNVENQYTNPKIVSILKEGKMSQNRMIQKIKSKTQVGAESLKETYQIQWKKKNHANQ